MDAESVTRNVTPNVPPVVGVPVSAPAALKAIPGGRLPLATDHVYGVAPPLATSPELYAERTVPLGRLAVAMDNGVDGDGPKSLGFRDLMFSRTGFDVPS